MNRRSRNPNLLERLHNAGIFHTVFGHLDPPATRALRQASKGTKRIVNNPNAHALARIHANNIAKGAPSKKVQHFIDALRAFRRLTIRLSRVKIPVPQKNNQSAEMMISTISYFLADEPVLIQMHKVTNIVADDIIGVSFTLFDVDYFIEIVGKKNNAKFMTFTDNVVLLRLPEQNFGTFVLKTEDTQELEVKTRGNKTVIRDIGLSSSSIPKIIVLGGLSLNQLAAAARDIAAIKKELLTFGIRVSVQTAHLPTTQAEFMRLFSIAYRQ